MCIVSFKLDPTAEYPFIFLGNRDEMYIRPSIGIHFWENQPNLLAGKDLQSKGTWLGITKEGRFATLLNHPFTNWEPQTETVSRGKLVTDFLTSTISCSKFTKELRATRHSYEGYQLVYGDINALHYYSNVRDESFQFEPGKIHSVSNTRDDLSQHRVDYASQLLTNYLQKNNEVDLDDLIEILNNNEKAKTMEKYPQDLSYEQANNSSSIFIESNVFGTVGSTAIFVDKEGKVFEKEVRYSPKGVIEATEKSFKLNYAN